MMIQVTAFPNLLFNEKVFSAAVAGLNEEDKGKALAGFKDLNAYQGKLDGILNVEPLKPKDVYAPIMELKIKLDQQEFRIFYVKIPKNHSDRKLATYAVLHAYCKKTSAILKKEKDAALRVKKKEGY